MEVNFVSNELSQVKPPVLTSGNEKPIETSQSIKFDYDKVMMNLEEVKNFLYMLIGGNIMVKEDHDIGTTINKLA